MTTAERTPFEPLRAGEMGSADRRPELRRRPSGEAPPLPKELLTSGKLFLAMGLAVTILWAVALIMTPFSQAVTRFDVALLHEIEELRNDVLTEGAKALHALGSIWVVRPLRWGAILVMLATRRFRHLFVFLAITLVVSVLTTSLAQAIGRPRPIGVEMLSGWDGFSHPSRPVAALALSLVGLLYTVVPQGRWRNWGKLAAGALVLALCASRVYLGIDHPTDVIVAVVIGMASPVVAFRLLTPNDVFPLTYKRGRSAHLDVGGRRGQAIRTALAHQLGVDVVDVKPFGLSGSAGSTPLRLVVRSGLDDEVVTLFGKLYAESHLRSDRWYKLGRTIRYGRLEDEHPYETVRRLVEYEDYLLRVMRDAGLPTALPYGFIEITPEREYLIVTEFFNGAEEIEDAEVDLLVIDEGLAMVRRLWDAGLAHRDIKPANLPVQDGKMLLIDVAFATVRPSPWRQAVDLANMMLVLGLRFPAEVVYERALVIFTANEVAEAFAASSKVTIPSQLRALLRSDQRDLISEFRSLAPERRPISIQRWSVRRIGLTMGVVIGSLFSLWLVLVNLGNIGLR